MKEVYFFDSYALVEILKGNENYKKYAASIVVVTKLNLFELFYGLSRDVGEKEAEAFLKEYSACSVDFNEDIIREASGLKLQHRKRNLSMADCIGYATAKRLGIKFLTGDKEFKDFENVEFVK